MNRLIGIALLLLLIGLFVLLYAAGCLERDPAPPTATVTPTATFPAPPTMRPTATATVTRKPTATATAPAPTPTATVTRKPTATAPAPTPTRVEVNGSTIIGWASYYAAGVFEDTMEAHREFAKYPAGLEPGRAAAVLDCDWKRDGRVLLVRPVDAHTGEAVGDGEWRPLWVVDCAGDRETAEWMQANNIIIEIDESLWDEWAEYHDRLKGLRVEVYLLE